EVSSHPVIAAFSTLSESHLYHAKSEGHSRPLNHRKSDSYTASAAQCRSAGAGISDPEGGGPPPGCRPQAFAVRPPRRFGHATGRGLSSAPASAGTTRAGLRPFLRDQRRAAPLIFRYDIPFIAARRPL